MSRIWCVTRRLEISAVVSAEEAGEGGKRREKAGKSMISVVFTWALFRTEIVNRLAGLLTLVAVFVYHFMKACERRYSLSGLLCWLLCAVLVWLRVVTVPRGGGTFSVHEYKKLVGVVSLYELGLVFLVAF